MKYFVNAAERAASGHEDYFEFQNVYPKDDIWDSESLYMSEEVMHFSGFGEFWDECARKHGFYSDTIFADEWSIMVEEAKKVGGVVLEVVNEFSPWIEERFAAGEEYIGVVDGFERDMFKRRKQREECPIDPKFYEEVSEIDETIDLNDRIDQYVELLRKYNMPDCFFPYRLPGPYTEE